MKKIIISLIIAAFIVLCGCSSQNSETTAKDQTTATTQIESESTISESTAIPETITKENATSFKTATKDQTAQKDYADKNKSAAIRTDNIEETTSETTTIEATDPTHCFDNDSHSMPVGNMGQWFENKNDLEQFVTDEIQYWRDKRANGEISLEEYNQYAPTGYEGWSCSYCGKWTGNFKYR